MRSRARLSLLAGLTALLTLIGGGTAFALWSTSAMVTSSAAGATTGITQSLQSGDTLKVTYASSLLTAAGAVTLTNTGSRSAAYALSVLAASATASGLPGAVAVAVAPVASVSACTTTASLTSPTTGVLSTTTAVSPSGTLAASASVVLCVRTTMTATNVTTYADASLVLSLQGALSYGTGVWTSTATAVTVQQKVASSLLFFTDSSARYNILSTNVCVSIRDANGSGPTAVTSGICDFDNLGQFRIADSGNGDFFVSAAKNSTSQPVAPRWVLSSATSDIATTTAADVSPQRWTIVKRADGRYRLQNEAYGTCATVSTAELYPGSGTILVGATCDDSLASQGFTFTQVSTPIPPNPYAMTCGNANGGEYLQYSWPLGSSEYQQEVRYTVYVNGVLYNTVGTVPDGYNTYVQFHRAQLTIATYGSGTLPVIAKQSIAGSTPVTIATGSIVIDPANNNLSCG